ncbi:MAG TPA: tRNA (adenosine(37)-N6)-dimethylallyltransferase MiaA [Anaerolineae bacterium]|nr:tRNA (adenosine(37)-N6)-dimethylallyltransferase MiaA [Anaerolineae bacterium]HQI83093.1 tRNA (adenosine(37)-N6)-dimethylallyltransferase MiaA [Anaerolineae bacterium]
MQKDALIPVIAIVGPTAVGKTALALTLGEMLAAEIVSADSRQFYRWMDIGTAKPTAAERARVVHHLIDIADPDETVGLAQFLRLARAAIADVAQRGRIPLLVGGTGQYVRALLEGWQTPEVAPDPALRATLEAQAAADPAELWARLSALDPEASAFIDPRNVRRIIRALEVCLKTGQPFSQQRRHVPPPYYTLQLGLTMERAALYARADTRVEAMMAAGLPTEVEGLLQRGYDWRLPAMSGLGYGQFRPYFAGEATLAEVSERIKLDTHAFIRRQYAWFHPQALNIHWLDPAASDDALARVRDFLRAA